MDCSNSAQRLLASKVWAVPPDKFVLIRVNLVLNAYWHQRFGQREALDIYRFNLACSTPTGIKGLGRLKKELTVSFAE